VFIRFRESIIRILLVVGFWGYIYDRTKNSYSPIARVDRNRVDVQVRVSNPQRIGFVKN
jgi:hypothetical protein